MSEDWIRTTNLCYQKRPLYRPLLLALFLGALFCRSKVESSLFIDWYLVTHIVQCWKDRTLGPRYIAIYFQDPYLLYKRSLFPRGQFKHSCWRCNVLYLLITVCPKKVDINFTLMIVNKRTYILTGFLVNSVIFAC